MQEDRSADALAMRPTSADRTLAIPEILDAIFAHLHLPSRWDISSDRSALRACTLVNRSWTNTGRRHLWSALSFHVVTPGGVDTEERPLPPSTLDMLYEFLTASIAIRQEVRSLSIIAHYGQRSDTTDATTLYSILCVLPALQHLVLDNVCQRLTSLPQIQHRLSLRSMEVCGGFRDLVAHHGNLVPLVDMFNDVGELIFGDCWLAPLWMIDPSPRKTRVTSIEFASTHNTLDFIAALRHFDTEPSTALAITFSGLSRAQEIQEAISKIGLNRTEISIRVNDAIWSSPEGELSHTRSPYQHLRCLA